jgi:predicted AAA+ superfamily ATPase
MRNVLISQNGHWQKPYQNLYSRKVFELLLENVSVRHIQVLQGIRRSGKSSLFKLLINQLLHSVDAGSILYVNLDDPFFIQYANNPAGLYEIIQTAETLTQKKIQYLFLDEVQAISGWEKYVKSMYDSELFKKIFITGSNSSLLSGEFATLLTGRYLSRQIYPLSFNEILRINDIDTFMRLNEELPKVLKIVDDMMTYGSFVEVYNAPDAIKREIISSYYEAIFFKDCVANTGIRDIKGFKELSFYLTSNIVTLFSYSSLARVVKLSDVSVKDYIYALGSSYLFSELNQFSYSLKEQASTKKKLYLTDNSFMKLSFCE